MLMSRSRMEYRLSTLSLQGIVLLGALEIGTMHFFRHCLIQLRGHFAKCPVAQRSSRVYTTCFLMSPIGLEVNQVANAGKLAMNSA